MMIRLMTYSRVLFKRRTKDLKSRLALRKLLKRRRKCLITQSSSSKQSLNLQRCKTSKRCLKTTQLSPTKSTESRWRRLLRLTQVLKIQTSLREVHFLSNSWQALTHSASTYLTSANNNKEMLTNKSRGCLRNQSSRSHKVIK